MARIRTIKPEFFTSEDIVDLSPISRLLYIALWCEADREGRFRWKPKTFKLRYFPGDDIDIEAHCNEVIENGLIVLYGDGLAYIPKFSTHQHVNPRESKSELPPPPECQNLSPPVEYSTKNDASSRVSDASSRDSDAQVGREGEGKERKEEYASSTRLLTTFSEKEKRLKELFPLVDFEVEKEKCLNYYKTDVVDPYQVIMSWLQKAKPKITPSPPEPVKSNEDFIAELKAKGLPV